MFDITWNLLAKKKKNRTLHGIFYVSMFFSPIKKNILYFDGVMYGCILKLCGQYGEGI